MSDTVNLFMVYSPLHYICSEQIAKVFCQDEKNILFYIKEEFAGMVRDTCCAEAVFLPWPRFYPEKGVFGRLQRTLKNLEIVQGYCSGFKTIRIHTPVIDTEATNYFINHLSRSFPQAKVVVRLVPDGVLNIQRHPLGRVKEALQYVRKVRRLYSRRLDYYMLRGDRTGSEAAIVDRIYLLPGFPHEYCPDKVMEMPPFHQKKGTAAAGGELRALVIGQPLQRDRRLTEEQRAELSGALEAYLERCGMSHVDYKAHPREAVREFLGAQYREINPTEALETFLLHNHYDIVIGIYSTALLTARMILPESSRVISFGFDQVFYKDLVSKAKVQSVFEKVGVEMVASREGRAVSSSS